MDKNHNWQHKFLGENLNAGQVPHGFTVGRLEHHVPSRGF